MSERIIAKKKRLMDAIALDRRDPKPRLGLAEWYRARGQFANEDRCRQKARQCERFDPEYDYADKLEKYGLHVVLYADGEVGQLCDGPFEYWFDPGEFQHYLDTVSEKEWAAWTMPLSEVDPPYSVIERLVDDEEVPGDYYACPLDMHMKAKLKRFRDNSYLLLELNEQPMFLTREQANVYGLDPQTLRRIS